VPKTGSSTTILSLQIKMEKFSLSKKKKALPIRNGTELNKNLINYPKIALVLMMLKVFQ
jgi:hypothetical protein